MSDLKELSKTPQDTEMAYNSNSELNKFTDNLTYSMIMSDMVLPCNFQRFGEEHLGRLREKISNREIDISKIRLSIGDELYKYYNNKYRPLDIEERITKLTREIHFWKQHLTRANLIIDNSLKRDIKSEIGAMLIPLLEDEVKILQNSPQQFKNELYGFKHNIDQKEIESLYKLLSGKCISPHTSLNHFKAALCDELIPDKYLNTKIVWLKSVPLFCCLFFGYQNLIYDSESLDFRGIINSKDSKDFYIKTLDLFTFKQAPKVNNRTLAKIVGEKSKNAPKDFTNLLKFITGV